jgi:YggT family protein
MIPKLLLALCQVYSWLIIARVLISWLNPQPRNEYLLMICRITDPLLDRLRGFNPINGIDLSPIFALILVRVACWLLERLFAL